MQLAPQLKPLFSFLMSFFFLFGLYSQSTKDFAVFFAVNDYEDQQFGSLQNPIKEVRSIAAELARNYNYDTLVLVNPKEEHIRATLERLGKLYQSGARLKNSQLLLFFSGHGYYNSREETGYFIPSNAKFKNIGGTAIPYFSTRRLINNIDCRHIAVVVDACFSGHFMEWHRMRSIRKDTSIVDRFGEPKNAPKDLHRIIAGHATLKTRLFLTSAYNDETPDDSDFAYAFLKALRKQVGQEFFTLEEIHANHMKLLFPRPVFGAFGDNEPGAFFLFFPRIIEKKKSLPPKIEASPPPVANTPSVRPYLDRMPPGGLMNGMLPIPAGKLSLPDPTDSYYKVAHDVHSFLVDPYEVTFAQFDQFCKKTRRRPPADQRMKRGNHPVINVSWLDAVAYCNWRSLQEELEPCYRILGNTVATNDGANGYRLPTELEWEYLATQQNIGKDIDAYAWHSGNSKGKTQAVGSKNPAPGMYIFDLFGNVAEWCNEAYAPFEGMGKPVRGGSWANSPRYISPSYRKFKPKDESFNTIGFRCVRLLK